MNVCTKFHSNPSNSSQEFSLKITNVKLMVALEENTEDHQSLQDSSSEDLEWVSKITWEFFQKLVSYFSLCGPTADISIPRTAQLTRLKEKTTCVILQFHCSIPEWNTKSCYYSNAICQQDYVCMALNLRDCRSLGSILPLLRLAAIDGQRISPAAWRQYQLPLRLVWQRLCLTVAYFGSACI